LPTCASAVVNPHLPNSNYPFKEISGSLVSLKVIEAVSETLYQKYNKDPFSR
jgi:single-stranded DNA-specific DHH superfamily exonuclease